MNDRKLGLWMCDGAGGRQHHRHGHLHAAGGAGAVRPQRADRLAGGHRRLHLPRDRFRGARAQASRRPRAPLATCARRSASSSPSRPVVYWISVWVTTPRSRSAWSATSSTVFPGRGHPARGARGGVHVAFVGGQPARRRSGGRVQVVTSLLKVVPLLVVMGVGASRSSPKPETYTSNLPTTPVTGSHPWRPRPWRSRRCSASSRRPLPPAVPGSGADDSARDPDRHVIRRGRLCRRRHDQHADGAPGDARQLRRAIRHDHRSPARRRNGRWVSLFVVISGLGCLNGWTLLSGELHAHAGLPTGYCRRSLATATASACPGPRCC